MNKLIPKYLSGFSFNSSPLNLGPYSTTNIFKNSLIGFNNALQYANFGIPIVNTAAYSTGQILSNSSNPITSQAGKNMVNEAINTTGDVVSSTVSEIVPDSDSGSGDKAEKRARQTKIGATLGLVGDTLNSIIPQTEQSALTTGLNSAYDTIADTVSAIPGVGTLAGGIMKVGSALSNGLTALGVGTDQMTKTDLILDSSFFKLSPVGLMNSIWSSKADTIYKDEDAFAKVGSSYGGTSAAVDEALNKSGKKYGLFSRGSLAKANQEIAEAKRQQSTMSDIADEATNRLNLQESMTAINNNRLAFLLQGGYRQNDVRVGKSGMSLELINKAKKISWTRKLQTGGTAKDPFEYYVSTLPMALRDSSNFRVRDYWLYNGLPKDFDEARKKGMFEWVEDFDKDGKSLGWSWHAFTVAKNPNADEYDFMKSASHPTVLKELDWYNSNSPDAIEFRNNYELQRTEPYWKYVRRKRNTISHKSGGLIISTEILLVVPEFQNGGLVNKKLRTLLELIEYAKKENPRFILRMSEPLRYINLGNGQYATHLMGYEFDPNTLKWYVYSQVLEDDNGNLKLYDFPEAFERALKKKDVLEMTLDEAKLFTESEELPDGTFKGYKAGWPDFFKLRVDKFLEGGSVNVIPEGALHARKNNMDMEGITPKGIPVVSNREGGEVEQLAEIEREEIIFRLEVTKKLEELEKKFYDNETSQKEKDECALEAGKLLVEEILYNTLDNTNKLL